VGGALVALVEAGEELDLVADLGVGGKVFGLGALLVADPPVLA